jgi:hypothetical protein
MAPMIRFKVVQIDSNISFAGKKRKKLKYPVRSVSLVPKTKLPAGQSDRYTLPEIFWQ